MPTAERNANGISGRHSAQPVASFVIGALLMPGRHPA